jgi:putative ABC transport system permease protein
MWGDAESLMAAYRRNGFQSVTARLTTPAAIEHLRAALAADPRLRVDVETTRAYYSKQSERLTRIGGLFPALRAATLAVTAALRES